VCNAMSTYPRIADYMSTPVYVVKPSDSLARARRLMLRYRVGRLVVVDDAGRPVGIITMNDFVKIIASRPSKPLSSIPVSDAMTSNPVTITADKPLREAARLMLKHGISGLPVVDDDGRLVGIITESDVVRAFAERLRGKYKVEDFMEREVPEVSPWHSVYYVAELIESSSIHRVVVTDAGRVVGIIAPSDLAFLSSFPQPVKGKGKAVRRFAELPKGRLGPVYSYTMLTAQDVMTPDPITVGPDEDLAVAARLMLAHGISSIPVVREDMLQGIVVKHNILKAIAES
jgi:CBS domain-containing protein